MRNISDDLHAVAKEKLFSGVIVYERDGIQFAEAFGLRDRANLVGNGLNTRFGIASGTKGFTALGIAKLLEEGKLDFEDSAAQVLDRELAWLPSRVTIGNLLGHTSGIADHLDEDVPINVNDFFLDTQVRELVSPVDYFPLIAKKEQKFPPGIRFSYSNSGYVVLAAIIEKTSGIDFPAFIKANVFDRADMSRTGFFRTDSFPEDTAFGYLNHHGGNRTNIFNLPIIGSGDGGAYSTADDIRKFWGALLSGRIIGMPFVSEFLREKVYVQKEKLSYGLGFWLDETHKEVILEGYDSGVSFRTAVGRDGRSWYAILSNTSSGAWPILKVINSHFQQTASGNPDEPGT